MNESKNTLTPERVSKEYKRIIARNIQKIIDANDCSQNKLAEKIRTSGIEIPQSTISKYLSGQSEIQLSFIIKICDIFNVSILDLADKDFQCTAFNVKNVIKDEKKDTELSISNMADTFISNPHDKAFSGYLQKYYCYFFPTLSSESELLEGELELKEDEDSSTCKAFFSLKTNKSANGQCVVKYYSGFAVISKTVGSCYIILNSPNEGEICLINLRHFSIRHQYLECRMAEVITNGAGERHFPTVHRMFLSQCPIKREHIKYIEPHLNLNSSKIYVERTKLEDLKQEKTSYESLINHLVHNMQPEEIYSLKEDYVISNASQYLSKEETRYFLSKIRDISYKHRYNKVSNKLDEIIHELLRSLGYYAETKL